MDFGRKLENKMNVWILVALGLFGAVGILLLFLGCGLYHNWWPLLAICMFITVPIPIVLCSSETNKLANDWSIFLAGFFAAISFGTFFLLAQYGNITWSAFGFSVSSVVVIGLTGAGFYMRFLSSNDEDDGF